MYQQNALRAASPYSLPITSSSLTRYFFFQRFFVFLQLNGIIDKAIFVFHKKFDLLNVFISFQSNVKIFARWSTESPPWPLSWPRGSPRPSSPPSTSPHQTRARIASLRPKTPFRAQRIESE
jgi:hypothetical protein